MWRSARASQTGHSARAGGWYDPPNRCPTEGTRTPDDADSTVRRIPLSQITADPGQPRQTFDRTALGELAASIRANGLLQPITVRQVGPDAYQIIAGERRFRATEINGSATIRAIVVEPTDAADIRVKQIIENDQRVDVTPLEQARSYQALMDETGWTVEELGQHIGKAPHRITERTVLLKLAPSISRCWPPATSNPPRQPNSPG